MARGFSQLIAGAGVVAVLAGGLIGFTPESASAAGRADCERGERNAIDGLPEPEIVAGRCHIDGREGPFSVHFDRLTRHERSTDPRGELDRGHDMRVSNVTVECREWRYDRDRRDDRRDDRRRDDRDDRIVFRGCGRAR
jgi:hypothetical protein